MSKYVTEFLIDIFIALNNDSPEGIATAESYSAASRTVIIDSLPRKFITDDMKTIAIKIGKTLLTVRRKNKRAIESGEMQMIKAGEYRKFQRERPIC